MYLSVLQYLVPSVCGRHAATSELRAELGAWFTGRVLTTKDTFPARRYGTNGCMYAVIQHHLY